MDAPIEPPPSVDEPQPECRRFDWLIWAIPVVFVFYPLSLGPAVAFYHSAIPRPLQRSIEIFYRPLEVVAQNSRSASRFFGWYVDFFTPKTPLPVRSSIG